MNEDSIPSFSPDVDLVLNDEADAWSIVGKNETLSLGATASAMVRLVDGSRSVSEIVTLLAERTGVPKPQVMASCLTFFEDLEDRSLLTLD